MQNKAKFLHECERSIPIITEVDIVVVGGGVAGCSAAVAATRNGARVLLIDKYPFLGGTATASLVGCFCGLYTCSPNTEQVVWGHAQEIVSILEASGHGFKRRHRFHLDYEMLKLVLDEWVIQAGVELLLHTAFAGLIKEHARIKAVIVENMGGRGAILAKTVIDCTGDGDVFTAAGEPYALGGSDGTMQAPSTIFYMNSVDVDRAMAMSEQDISQLLQEAAAKGKSHISRFSGSYTPTIQPGKVHVNMTRIPNVNATDPASYTEGEIEGRRQVRIYAEFLRRYVPGFENAHIDAIGSIGIRETRRLVGKVVLTGADVLAGRKFANAICRSAWPIEDHNSNEMHTRRVHLEGDDYYHIPFDCLLPTHVDNLLVSGRCISVDHEAQASTRVMGACFGTGQAAGTAAALALDRKCSPKNLDISALQEVLIKQGVVL